MIAIKNALFPIPLRIDPPIGASGKAHPQPPGEGAPIQRHSNRGSVRFRHLIEDAKRPGQLTNAAAALCSSQNRHLGDQLLKLLVSVGIEDRRPGCIDIGHQLSRTGVPVWMVLLGKDKIACGEVSMIHPLDIDAKVSE
jgi:hypothetical protein